MAQKRAGLDCFVRALLVASALAMPTGATGQGGVPGAIAGSVSDTTGALLPGVTVEASSPALIERVRTTVTNEKGQYRIVDLRPGEYSVTFSLQGFTSVVREGIKITGAFTANVDVQLSIGAVAETVTVSGASPIVDVQNVVQARAITAETIDALPTGRTFQALATTIPGVSRSDLVDVAGTAGERVQALAIHGTHTNDMPLIYDGMRYNNLNGTGSGGGVIFMINTGNVQEMTVEYAAAGAENQNSGVFMNIIPKDGGNTFRGYFFSSYSTRGLQADNWTGSKDLAERGVVIQDGVDPVNTVDRVWDINPAFGGPIRRNVAWFYTAFRYWGNSINVPNAFFNSTPNSPFYTPDLSRPAKTGDTFNGSQNIRLTLAPTSQQKFSAYYDIQQRGFDFRNVSATVAPEAAEYFRNPTNYVIQTKWNWAASDRIFVGAGAAMTAGTFRNWHSPLQYDDTIAIQELSTGLRYAGMSNRPPNRDTSYAYNERLDVSYISGSHSMKFGLQMAHGTNEHYFEMPRSMTAQFRNGVPQGLTVWATPYERQERLNPSPSLFAQDQWTFSRFTLNYGLRLDYLNASIPPQTVAETLMVPARSFDAVEDVPNWLDISPRFGMSWDVFGNRRTALKMALGRYVASQALAIAIANNPINTSVTSANRTWTDHNGDFNPDCDFRNLDANGECGAISNRNFGQNNPRATRYDPDVLKGFGKRPVDWEFTTGVQHELVPGVSVTANYIRRWFSNNTATENRAVTAADYDPYCVTAPVDPRLPGGGGYQVCGLFDIKPEKFGLQEDHVTFSKNFGNQVELYNGGDLSINARLPKGAFLQGGVAVGRKEADICYASGSPNISATLGRYGAAQGAGTPRTSDYCNVTPPWSALTQVKLAGMYTLPWELAVSATYSNIAGPEVTATAAVNSAAIAPSLGRPLSAGATANVQIELIPPATMYERRVNQLDARLARSVKFGDRRFQAMVDVYNVLNWSSVLGQNLVYGPQWRQVQNVGWTSFGLLPGRLVKFALQVDW